MRGWIGLLCAWPALAFAGVPHPACVASGEIATLVEANFEGGLDEREPLVLKALESHPNDVHLHRALQDGHRGDGSDLLERYREASAAHPEDPMWPYLSARVLDDRKDPAAETTYQAALEIDPNYPWAHLGLAHFYDTVRKDPAQAQAHIAAAIDQCPNSEFILRRLGDLPKEQVVARAASLRERLSESRDPSLLTLLRATWTAEFKVLPPSEHAELRSRIRSDLAWLRGPGLVEDQRALDALLAGYRIVGDDGGLEWAIGETARRYPEDGNARSAAFEKFRERTPQPDDCDAAASRVVYGKLSEATQRWIELWPKEPSVRMARLQALARTLEVPVEQVAAAADAVRTAAAARANIAPGTPVTFEAAQTLVQTGRALDRVPALIDAGQAEIRSRAAKGETAERDPERAARGVAMRVQAHLQLGEVDAARAQFAELSRVVPIDVGKRVLTPEQEAGWRKDSALRAVLEFQPTSCKPEDENADLRVAEILAPELVEFMKQDRVPVPGRKRLDGFETKSLALAEFALQDLTGRTWRASDLQGKVTLIHLFWAEIPITRAMLPWMEEIGAKMRGRPDFVLLAFSLDDDLAKLEPMVKDSGFTFAVVPARDYVKTLVDRPSLPLTWIVDRKGTIVRESGGFSGDKDGWIEAALQAIGEVGAQAP
jgi:tetratricopeptide (TPR) repeat protein